MTKKILIVDDEPHIVELQKAILETEGFSVDAAENGQKALDKLKNSKPDLVILDMMMPGMSGREVCEQIRKNPKTKKLKVVFVTVARFSEAGRSTLESLNVLDYVTKPFDNKQFVNRIKQAINSAG